MSTKKFNSKSVFALVCIAISVVWMYLGITKYGLWDAKEGPMSGFFPIIIGGVLLLSSIIFFFKSFSMEGAKYDKGAFQLMAAMAAVFGASYLIGLLPALLVFYIFWLRVMEKMPVRTIIISTAVVGAIVYGTFAMWLKVPFPEGLLLEMMLG